VAFQLLKVTKQILLIIIMYKQLSKSSRSQHITNKQQQQIIIIIITIHLFRGKEKTFFGAFVSEQTVRNFKKYIKKHKLSSKIF